MSERTYDRDENEGELRKIDLYCQVIKNKSNDTNNSL